MSEIVLPNHTNTMGNMMGGELLYLMDMCSGIVSQRHANRVCVTASVDSVEFRHPIRHGDVVILEGRVNRAFNTSMEVEINVWSENPRTGRKTKSNRAYYTMVALDEELNPVKIPKLKPASEAEEARYESAERRRQLRLVLAGRIKLNDAETLLRYIRASTTQPEKP